MKREPKRKMIRPVSVELLMEADRKIAADHEAGLDPDPDVSAISVLHGKCSVQEIIAIIHRLTALAHLIVNTDTKGWTIKVDDAEHAFVSGALIRAAATAPLREAKMVRDLAFNPKEIMEIALREAETSGSA